MARFGQGLIQGLINPGYELNTTGMMAGGLAGSIAERRKQEEQKEMARRMAMLEAGGQSITEKANQAKQRQQSTLLGQVMTAPEELAGTAQRAATQANIPIAQVTAAANERRAGAKAGQTQAQNQAVATFFKAQGRPDLEELAIQGVIPPSSVKSFLGMSEEAVKKSFAAGKNDYIDDEGNYYSVTTVRDPSSGSTQTRYTPITPGAPSTPVGKITPVGGAYSETADQKRNRQIEESGGSTQAKKYGELRVQAVTNIPSLASSVDGFDRALALLDNVETGGVVQTANTALERFFGTMSGDKAELQLRLGLEMFSQLKPFFGGVISDSERGAIEEIYAGLKKGNAANAAIVRSLKNSLEKTLDAARIMSKAETFEEYNDKMSRLYPENTGSDNEVVYQWGSGGRTQ